MRCLQVNKAFSERRKMLRNTLQPLYTSQQVSRAASPNWLSFNAAYGHTVTDGQYAGAQSTCYAATHTPGCRSLVLVFVWQPSIRHFDCV